ncbi:MAG: sulfatase-like hydrolase/transferase, partial [Coraliomargaritaceae bacterium]
IVIFTADNGAEGYAYERVRKLGHWSSGEFRGLKRDLWEGGHRVPFIVKWPGVIEAGMVSNEVISQVDLAATFASILNHPLKEDEAVDSMDLFSLLKDQKSEKNVREATVQNTRAGHYALRQGDWMLIDASSGQVSKTPDWFNFERGYGTDTTPSLLYNLKEDPAQKKNLYSEYPERVVSMRKNLSRILKGRGQRLYAEYEVGYQLPEDARITYPNSNPLRDSLKPIPTTAIFQMEGWSLWDPSLIKVGNTYHLFCSRWPKTDDHSFDSGWKRSHVIRATSKNLFGPYTFAEVVLHPSNHPWATRGIHNPKIIKAGKRFLLYHLGIPGWSTGFAYADSIEGPWEPLPNPVVKANNPALLLQEDGSAYMVSKHKPKPTRDGKWDACMIAHRAEQINGPYEVLGTGRNRLPHNSELEDPTIWWANEQYNLICTDWEGKVTGIQKPLVYYTSKDGVDYELYSKIPLWSQEEALKMEDGTELQVSRIERPQVYINEEGALTALLVAVGVEERSHDFIVIRPVDSFIPSH